jgi:hypothetical protein
MIHGTRYVTESSVVAFAKEERRVGRPVKLRSPLQEAFSGAAAVFKKTSK